MKTVTVLGPSQSGKTTLAAALAALEGAPPSPLALFGGTAVTAFRYLGEDWAVLDCPGGGDALAWCGAALVASDAAVLCVPAEAEAAVLAAPYLRLLEEAGLPTLVFVNKLDAARDRMSEVAAALQTYSRHGIVLREVPIREGDRITGMVDLISERAWQFNDGARSSLVELPAAMRAREAEARADLLEHLADFDDHLLEELVEDRRPMDAELYEVATRVLQHHDLIPAFLGSASQGDGLNRLMKGLRHEVPGVEALSARLGEAPLAVGIFADQVKHLGKTVLIRAVGGEIGAGVQLAGGAVGSLVGLDGKTPVTSLPPGNLALTVKTEHLSLRDPLYAAGAAHPAPDWARPHVGGTRVLLSPENERDEARLSTALAKLSEIDPGLALEQEAQSGKSVLATQGPLHQRGVIEKLGQDFGLSLTLAPLPAALRETVSRPARMHHRHRKQSGGAGQFADVVIEIAPLPRGSGFEFSETVKGGAVPRNYIPAVEAGVRDALAGGPNGCPVVDLRVTLTDGKHHAVDSSDFAFRTAGRAATREALSAAKPVLLQPVDRVEIHVPGCFSGALVPLVTGLKGQVLGFEAHPDAAGWDVFTALLPAASEEALAQALGSACRGTAWYEAALDHYEETRGDAGTLAAAV
ncbi:elongation factor G [Celeribacter indicus]|uniref:Elongation factor G n=1 Tax=Celeribacter indicus TaxID=1208324 RepID=A0A0B5DQ26_9RHOB|nr:elongation factor G [Celeribacter indicus]AJE45224.1 elongation factor G [Celeribacter indicus]SDX45673.1 elongation factor G [Celeribacter indicus]